MESSRRDLKAFPTKVKHVMDKVGGTGLHPLSNDTRKMKNQFTRQQGQYLAFIFYYTKILGRAPAEADMQTYFEVSPPSVHQMILTLEAKRLIERTPGQARSIRLLLAREDLPNLD